MKKLVLIRHAESERNKALDGSLFLKDPTLLELVGKVPDHKIKITEKGIEQAKATSKHLLKEIGIPDVVFHSGYTRTRQTAEHVLSAFPKDVKIKENLSIREREGGYTHTLLEEEKNKYFPFLQDYWQVVGGLFARPVGGESLMDVVEQRLKPFLNQLNEEHKGETVFLVTHGRVIQCLRFILDEMTWEEMEKFIANKSLTPKNCGVSVYNFDEKTKKLKLEIWNKVWWK